MTAAEAVKAVIEPMLLGWSIQFGHWKDPGPQQRSAVLKPAGGGEAELVRRPQFTLSLVGTPNGDRLAIAEKADEIVETIRANAGALVYLSAGEPAYMPTADGRPVFEIALGAIAN